MADEGKCICCEKEIFEVQDYTTLICHAVGQATSHTTLAHDKCWEKFARAARRSSGSLLGASHPSLLPQRLATLPGPLPRGRPPPGTLASLTSLRPPSRPLLPPPPPSLPHTLAPPHGCPSSPQLRSCPATPACPLPISQKKSFVRGRGTSNRTQSFFCPVAGCHNVLQHQHLSVRKKTHASGSAGPTAPRKADGLTSGTDVADSYTTLPGLDGAPRLPSKQGQPRPPY